MTGLLEKRSPNMLILRMAASPHLLKSLEGINLSGTNRFTATKMVKLRINIAIQVNASGDN